MASKELIQAIGNVQTAFSGLIVLAEINEIEKDKAEKQCEAALEDRDEAFKKKNQLNSQLTEEKKQSGMKDDVIDAREKAAIARNSDTRRKQREMDTTINNLRNEIENLKTELGESKKCTTSLDNECEKLAQLLRDNNISIP